MKYSEVLRRRHLEIAEQRAAKARGDDPRCIIPTNLREFDKRAGVKRGIMTLVGASTGEGKDMWMLHLASAAAQNGYSVEVLSMEDPTERTADRSLSTLTGINNAKMQALELDDKEVARIALAAAEAEEWGELIEWHQGAIKPGDAMKLLRASAADLRMINYLQAFPGDGESLERVIAEFCWQLNELAQTTNCAVVAFSQTNLVKVEERGLRVMEQSLRRDAAAPPNVEGFRPFGPSDLAWCTAAGQRAKDFQVLFRPGRYLRRAGRNVADDRMEISRPKNNFGAEGKVAVGFDAKTARFFDLPEKKNG